MSHFVKLEVITEGSNKIELFNTAYITGAFKVGQDGAMITLKDKLPVMVNHRLDDLLERLNGQTD